MSGRLAAYVNDHLAGSAIGLALARRIRDGAVDPALRAVLDQMVGEIHEERATLVALLGRLGSQPDPVRQATGFVAERASRLRLDPMITRSRDLTRLLELETLSLGVEGKRLLWLSLAGVDAADEPALAALDAAALAAKADRQRADLEPHRVAAAVRVAAG